MTQEEVVRLAREAAQAALEALVNGKKVRAYEDGTKYQPPLEDAAIEALRSALAEQTVKESLTVAEPVAWYLPSPDGDDSIFRDHRTVIACTGNKWEGFVPLYTHPPHREWKSLTRDEIADIALNCYAANGAEFDDFKLAAAIEAKLKGKNYD